MLDKIIPKKIKHLFDLIRLDKPVGFMLLMWPSWFAMANISKNISVQIEWYFYFFIGAFLMRSAGCIINDLIDINIDKNVKRTSSRPLTSNKVSKIEALLFLILLLFFSFLILLKFNFNSILMGILSIPLIIFYPFLKRYTYFPQLGLGIVFNWGVLIVSIQFIGAITLNYILLYLACIAWTLAYDTIYAYQDREDDVNNNIKSTAVLFGFSGLKYVQFFYIFFFVIIGFLGFHSSQSFISLIVIIAIIIAMNIYLKKWELNSRKSSNYYFKFNNIVGLICFLFLSLF
jgi:4-hydroxybenzoate polyprenyltransferase